LVFAHFVHVAPPQSTSVSAPFFTRSEHVGVWQIPPLHTPLTQSFAIEHILPFTHLFMHVDPQSMSVSVPFFTPSEHVGAWQNPPVQTPLVQSVPARHILLFAHFGHDPPPQSTSVSAPFFIVSLQVAFVQMLATHTLDTQSVFDMHILPSAHFGHAALPQSMSVSLPFFELSAHDWQLPDPLQANAPAHSLSGSALLAMLPHEPSMPAPFLVALHAWQRLLHVVLQHVPSTQWRFRHSLFIAQPAPSAFTQPPDPLHTFWPEHVPTST
jgi:hypothetical protein